VLLRAFARAVTARSKSKLAIELLLVASSVAGASGRLLIGVVSLFFFIEISRLEIDRRLGKHIFLRELLLSLELAAVSILTLSDGEWLFPGRSWLLVLLMISGVDDRIRVDLVLHAGNAACFKHRISH